MRNIVIHFFRLEILNLHPFVYWGLAGVWLLLIVSAFASVRSLTIPILAKNVWVLIILAVPILGLAAYAFRCLARANWYSIKPLFLSRRVSTQLASAALRADPKSKA